MAAPTESRQPDATVIIGATRTLGLAAPREACLSTRLWAASGDSTPVASLWENESPASGLILDLIAACEGEPTVRQGEVLTAGFASFQAAILAARRLQWAMQGFGEGEERQTTCLALLIHSPEDGPAESVAADVFHSLGKAAPGAILLTQKAGKPIENLPGFPLQEAAGDGLRQLQWRCPEEQASRSSDEEMLAQLVEEQGAQAASSAPSEPPAESFEHAAEERKPYSREAEAKRGSSRLLIGGMALAAVVAIGAVVYFNSGKTAPIADQSQAVTANSEEPAGSAGTTAQPGAPASAAHAAHPGAAEPSNAPAAAKNSKPAKNELQPPAEPPAQEKPPERERPAKPAEPPAAKAVSGGRCDLDSSQFGGQIDLAWKNLGRGKYNDAKREFGAVLACDPGNARAKEGMERARMAAAEADGSQ